MQNFKLKSYCKINLFLKVFRRGNNDYHNIQSLITFCKLHDVISIAKTKLSKDKINFSGKFKKNINIKRNTITKVLYLLRKKNFLNRKFFKIDVKKNIPHGSGLGGGSSNAAVLLNFFNLKMNLKINKKKLKKLAAQVGFDVPISLENKNTFLTGEKNKIIRIKKKLKLNIIIVYPNVICSTTKIYKKNKNFSLTKRKFKSSIKNNNKLLTYLKKETNDLEKIVVKLYPKIGELIDFIKDQKGCYFSRITGSGSACIGIFSNIKSAIYTRKLIKLKFPKYWSVVSKTI